MRVAILGGGGMVGQKLARRLAAEGLAGVAPEVTLWDRAFPAGGAPGVERRIDLTEAGAAERVMAERPEVIFHLAAVVSGVAEADFDLGWRVNVDAFRAFLEAVRAAHLADGYTPRVVFTSSIAVFGPPYPERIPDDFPTMPQTSYGAQKAIGELMVAEFSRKGFMDGLSLRLPTICVRPGAANGAASSFFSGIIREPLAGMEALLPVSQDVRHWHASPRAAAGFLVHAATLDTAALDGRRALNLPGVSCTVAEQIEALRAVAGAEAVARIRAVPDATVARIVAGWPRDFAPERALALGFRAEGSFREIVETYIAEDMPGA